MSHTKKILIFALSTLLIGGGAWYMGDVGIFDGLSSSALNSSKFTCTDANLQSQKGLYTRTVTRKKKGLAIRTTLTEKITQLQSTWADSAEIAKQQDMLKKLNKQLLIYSRFIAKYETCKREISLLPSVAAGIASGEVQVIPSRTDYQELAVFEIGSPDNLNTSITGLEFQVRLSLAWNIVVDNWVFLNDNATPLSCGAWTIANETITIDCDVSKGTPVNIRGGSQWTYRLGAHIVSVAPWAGSIEATISWIRFNDGRSGFVNNVIPNVIRYGEIVVPPVTSPVVPLVALPSDEASSATPLATLPVDTSSPSDVVSPVTLPIDTTLPSDVISPSDTIPSPTI